MRECCIDDVRIEMKQRLYNSAFILFIGKRIIYFFHMKDTIRKNANALDNIHGCPTPIAADDVSLDGTSTAH